MNRSEYRTQLARISAKIIGKSLRSAGTRRFLAEVASGLIDDWALKGPIRKKMSTPAKWLVSKVFKPSMNGSGEGISADVGKLITVWAEIVNTDHADDPVCHARRRGETILNFLKNTDFGEIREMVETSEPCFMKTVEAFNEQLWKYPAKVGSILGTLLAGINIGIRSVRETLRPIEKNVGPDLLADLILSLVKGLNAKEAAVLINAACEFVRRLHTGNHLLARAGKPLLQIYLTTLLQESLPDLDPVLVRKAKVALAEDREAVTNAMADALSGNPALVLEMVAAYGAAKTPLLKSASRKIRLFEDVDQHALAEALSKGLSDLDTYEIAEVINGFLRIINRIHEIKPEIFSNITHSIADSLDTQEVRSAAQWLIPEIADAVRPIVTAAAPQMKGLFSILYPQEGLTDKDRQDAVFNVKSHTVQPGGER
ncbi:MAG TPA: hypothetical protein VMU10_12890 [Desulfomonilia bacterium]|nr:hypothetical protein [Desulfomonilia bacterium]